MELDQDALQYFNLIGQLQKAIQKAEKLEEAITDSVMLFKKYLNSDYAIVWYGEQDQTTLHPYYFVGDRDLTFATREVGAGVVGRVYQNETAERMLQYRAGMDPETDRDFSECVVKSMICVPFSVGEESRGVLQFIRIHRSEPFTDESADVCEIMVHLIGMEIKENEKLCAPWRFHDLMMRAQNIQKTYQNGEERTVVLKGVNMDVYEGEFVVILGESGSGKSTFMNIIGGMDKADEGAFQFLGEEMSGKTQDELTDFRRDHIGFIFQNYNLISSLTAAQNIDLIGELVEDHLTSDEVLEMVGLSDKKNHYPSQLSGGQQQRVSIARALVKKPKLIFADEPTSALDFATGIEVLTVLENVVKSGTTLVMVTHNEEITRMADRVVRMRGGKTFDITLNRNPVHASELMW